MMTKSVIHFCMLPLLLFCVDTAPAGDNRTGEAAEFLDLVAARAAIIDDHLEPYFSTLEPLEMAAKTGAAMSAGTVAAQRDECRRRYQAGVLAFTADEQSDVSWFVAKARALIAKEYPLIEQDPWRYIKVSDDIEGGLPHTRGDCVVFARRFLARVSQVRKDMPEQAAMMSIGNTVIHEHLHVVQRLHPDLFVSLYTDIWHLRRAPAIVSDNLWLIEHHLANPDGVDCGWVFPVTTAGVTRWIWPLVIFGEVNGIAHMPNDFVMAAISLNEKAGTFTVVTEKTGRPEYADLMSIPEYTSVFAGSSNIYHPNESAADLFAKIVLFDAFAERGKIPANRLAVIDARMNPLRAWFKAHSAKK